MKREAIKFASTAAICAALASFNSTAFFYSIRFAVADFDLDALIRDKEQDGDDALDEQFGGDDLNEQFGGDDLNDVYDNGDTSEILLNEEDEDLASQSEGEEVPKKRT